jgi:hypothetical protein
MSNVAELFLLDSYLCSALMDVINLIISPVAEPGGWTWDLKRGAVSVSTCDHVPRGVFECSLTDTLYRCLQETPSTYISYIDTETPGAKADRHVEMHNYLGRYMYIQSI